jgi:hypothetical protein
MGEGEVGMGAGVGREGGVVEHGPREGDLEAGDHESRRQAWLLPRMSPLTLVRAEIKTWERDFASTHGRDPSVQDIRAQPSIGAPSFRRVPPHSPPSSREIQALQAALQGSSQPDTAVHSASHPLSSSRTKIPSSRVRPSSPWLQPLLPRQEIRQTPPVAKSIRNPRQE